MLTMCDSNPKNISGSDGNCFRVNKNYGGCSKSLTAIKLSLLQDGLRGQTAVEHAIMATVGRADEVLMIKERVVLTST